MVHIRFISGDSAGMAITVARALVEQAALWLAENASVRPFSGDFGAMMHRHREFLNRTEAASVRKVRVSVTSNGMGRR
jgi:hypothetical protein